MPDQNASAVHGVTVADVSVRGLNGIRMDEGRALRAYQDSVGVWTVGFGLTNYDKGLPWKVEKGLTITAQQAEWFLYRSLKINYEPDVRRAIDLPHVAHPQGVFDGGLSFHFNTGGILKASWPKALNRGAIEAARQSFLSWNKAGGKVLSGLTRRRAREWGEISGENYGTLSGPEVIGPGTNNRERVIGHGELLTALPTSPDSHEAGKVGNEPPPPPSTPAPGALKLGSTGPEVSQLQTDLTAVGFPTPVTGTFDEYTSNSVMKFQQAHPTLTADGTVGPATRAALDRALAMRESAGKVVKTAGPIIPAIFITLHQWLGTHAAEIFLATSLAAVGAVAVYLLWHYRHDLGAVLNKVRGRIVP